MLQRAVIERLQLELQTTLAERFQLERVELEEVLTEKFQIEVQQHAERRNKRKIGASETSVQLSSKKPLQLSLRREDVSHTGRFNKTQFVTDCLKENAAMTASEIKERAANIQQSISDSIISMARTTLKNRQLKEVELEKVVGD